MSYAWLPTHYQGAAPAVPGNLPRLPNTMVSNTYTASSASLVQPSNTVPGSEYFEDYNTPTNRQAPKGILRSPDSSYYSSTTSSSRSGYSIEGVTGQPKQLVSPRRVSFTRDTKQDTSMQSQLGRSRTWGSSGQSLSIPSSRYRNSKSTDYSNYRSSPSQRSIVDNSRRNSRFVSSSKNTQYEQPSYGRSNVADPWEKDVDYQFPLANSRSASRNQRGMSHQRSISGRKSRRRSRTP